MNGIVVTMLIFWVIGFVDYITGYHLRIGQGFVMGFKQVGSMTMIVIGLYTLGVIVVNEHLTGITTFAQYLPFDISVLTSMFLETSMGGYPIAQKIAATPQIANFSGLLVGAGIGCLVCFLMPVLMVSIEKKDISVMIKGLIPGILATPIGLVAGGLLYGMDIVTLTVNMIPVLCVCILLIVGVYQFPNQTQKTLTIIGTVMKIIAQGASMVVILGLFMPVFKLVSDEMSKEAIVMALKMTVTLSGGMVLSECILQYEKSQIDKIAKKIEVNAYSILGLIMSLVSPLIMFPLFKYMDKKGKIMNAAFTVMGTYVIGAPMAFVAQVTTSYNVIVFVTAKLIAGIAAIFLACFMAKRKMI